jgi:putative ABC transport system permease protein
MFRNYLKVLSGQIRKYKLQACINILGMAVGLSCCLLITVYVVFELSYDRHYANAERIYRVSGEFNSGSRAEVSALAGPLLQEEFPQVESYARLYGNTPGLITRGEFSAFEEHYRMADNGLFRIFDFEWLQGDPATALAEPGTVVLTESIAEKYFPGENPMGQVLGLAAQQFPMTVVGVICDLPENTHFQFSMLASLDMGVLRSAPVVPWKTCCKTGASISSIPTCC